MNARCDDALLSRTVADVRRELGLDHSAPAATRRDRWLFAGWAARAAAIVWGPLIPAAALAWWLLR